MFGSIDSEQDIDIFLTQKEIEQLSSRPLEGIIIKKREPKIQNPLILSIDKEKSRDRIGVEEKASVYQVFISPEYHDMLKENGSVGTRYDTLGSKIDLVEESHAENMSDFRFELRLLKTYVKHREELI